MTRIMQIHPDYQVYFRTLGNNIQTRVTQICTENYNQDSPTILVEPGRTIIIGDVKDELTRLFDDLGKPTLNQITATTNRPSGIFSTRSYAAMISYLYGENSYIDAPRARPEQRVPKIRFRDLEPI